MSELMETEISVLEKELVANFRKFEPEDKPGHTNIRDAEASIRNCKHFSLTPF